MKKYSNKNIKNTKNTKKISKKHQLQKGGHFDDVGYIENNITPLDI